ncbi:MAG: purine-nucleoside phosphorylase [Clostridia bacterium]|nr:purine-nucleoside phosphorylase [Clostridia bacterium]
MKMYPTPHINATPEDFAKTVLMPGDPLRAKYMAETFLESPRLVNSVRGINGYTGTYKGKPVSIMASGMGMPSIGIYAYELYSFFGVENIIRVGSAGAMQESIRVRDIVIGMGACTNSNFASQYDLPGTLAPIASFDLLKLFVDEAEKMGLRYHVGNLLSSDTFYGDSAVESTTPKWAKMGVMAVEMEAAGLYMTASRLNKRALAICTVSDHLITGEATTAEERQSTFNEMITLALECAAKL